MDLEFYFNLTCISVTATIISDMYNILLHTSQFVAVSGTRLNIHPSCDGRSEVSRIYLKHSLAMSLPTVRYTQNILICPHYSISSKVEPSTLHIRVKIRCGQSMCSQLQLHISQLVPSGPLPYALLPHERAWVHTGMLRIPFSSIGGPSFEYACTPPAAKEDKPASVLRKCMLL